MSEIHGMLITSQYSCKNKEERKEATKGKKQTTMDFK